MKPINCKCRKEKSDINRLTDQLMNGYQGIHIGNQTLSLGLTRMTGRLPAASVIAFRSCIFNLKGS